MVFCFSCLFFRWMVLVQASINAKSSHCFRICDRNSVHRVVVILAYTHCKKLMKSVGKLSILNEGIWFWTGGAVPLGRREQ